jgi:putative lipoic acid-binding regulatory protein
MTDPTAPVALDYPTYYTFKAMGLAGAVRGRMLELIAQVLGPVDDGAVTVRPSSAGKYESVSVQVFLRSEDERRRIYEAFHAAVKLEKVFVWYV